MIIKAIETKDYFASNMREKIAPIRSVVTRQLAKLELTQESRTRLTTSIEQLNRTIEDAAEARVIIQEVAQQTQKNMELHISNIVTLALNSVIPNPPEFIMRFEVRRNQTECDLLFSKNGNEYPPITNEAGGALDITSFALKVAFWSIRKNRPTLILDEPFKWVSPDLHNKVSDMLQQVSSKMGLQFIIVSHSEDVNIAADKTFMVTADRNEISTVRDV